MKDLQDSLGYAFKDAKLLRQAVTHRSGGGNYERLEFLGDRVLGVVVADMLYRNFPHEDEGDLACRFAALVCEETLVKVADELDLQTYIVTSGENRCNPSTRADVVEAVIAAVYSDGGFGPAKTLVERLLESSMMAMKTPPVDPKTALQELAQGAHLPLPLYTVVGEEGPPHAPRFLIKVQVQGYGSVTSEGTSKRQAQREAARLMMEKLKK